MSRSEILNETYSTYHLPSKQIDMNYVMVISFLQMFRKYLKLMKAVNTEGKV